MPTDIYFAAANVRVTVDEDPGQVADAFSSAQGVPFRLSCHGRQGEVYVNPAAVAFWSASGPSAQPELAQEVPQPAAEAPQRAATRETVTDIWGKPVRRKPRR